MDAREFDRTFGSCQGDRDERGYFEVEARRGPTNGGPSLHLAEQVEVAAAHGQHLLTTFQVDLSRIVVTA